jgi:hypothetical protein
MGRPQLLGVKMKRVMLIPAAIVMALGLSACTEDAPSATKSEQASSAQILDKMLKAQPVPQFDYSQIRQTLIDAQTAQANSTQTTSFFWVLGVPDPIFTCPSIGFPVASTAQITSPDQLIGNGAGSTGYFAAGVVKQIDPNGIYSGDSSATFALCVGAGGKVFLHQAEEVVHAVAGPAVWDKATKQIKMTGDPTFAVKTKK